ncbi:TRAP transporter small permease [Microbacterium sp. HA-8]|uniref:TRAP transporter small permease n=1 Tax=Microbacterium sp. HA-8 TaxID=3234200 RepID=UPI0038F66387
MAARLLDRALSRVDQALQVAAMVMLAIIVIAVAWQVLARYVVETSSGWTTEAATYSFVWLAMIAIALGVRRGRHMVLDIWEYLPYRRWLHILVVSVSSLAVIAVLAVLIWFGVSMLPASFSRSLPGLGVSYGWVALAVPVGCFFSLLFALEAWWRLLAAPRGAEALPQALLGQPADAIVVKGEY